MSRLLSGVFVLLLANGLAAPASASTISIDTTSSGWYDSAGDFGGSANYAAGVPGSNEIRNFFVFDLTGLTTAVTAAELVLFNPNPSIFETGYISDDPTETYAVFDVSSTSTTLLNGTGGVAAFSDLGTGTQLGQVIVSSADNGQTVSISLNAAGLALINANLGQEVVFGGAITTLSGTGIELVFGYSGLSTDIRRLDLTTRTDDVVPEPASLTLLGLGLVGLGARRRRQRKIR